MQFGEGSVKLFHVMVFTLFGKPDYVPNRPTLFSRLQGVGFCTCSQFFQQRMLQPFVQIEAVVKTKSRCDLVSIPLADAPLVLSLRPMLRVPSMTDIG